MTNASKGSMGYVNKSMQCTINLMQEIMELFRAPATSLRPLRFYVGFGSGGLQPISTSNNYGFNKLLLSRIRASNVGQNTYYMHVVSTYNI